MGFQGTVCSLSLTLFSDVVYCETAGQERVRTIASSYYRGARLFFLFPGLLHILFFPFLLLFLPLYFFSAYGSVMNDIDGARGRGLELRPDHVCAAETQIVPDGHNASPKEDGTEAWGPEAKLPDSQICV